ncbi:Asp23/Gls24 family envelope stress response protein [Rubneribacter sp.]
MTQSTMNASNAFAEEKAAHPAVADDVAAEPVYKLIIDESVVEKIASKSTQKIDGIIDMKGSLLSTIQEGLGGSDKTKGVSADVVDERNAKVDLDVILEYGKSAPQIFDKIKDVVASDLKDMTGLTVVEMTVNVVDVMTQDEFDQKNGNGGQQDGSSN